MFDRFFAKPCYLCYFHHCLFAVITNCDILLLMILLLFYCRISVLVFHFQDWMFHSFLQQLSENTYMYLSGLLWFGLK